MTRVVSAVNRSMLWHGRLWWFGYPRLLFLFLLIALLMGCGAAHARSTESYMREYVGSEAKPGAGVRVVAARSNVQRGYFAAAVVAELLRELGYEVTQPEANEMGPAVFYPAVARGVVDYWASGWFPFHDANLAAALPRHGIIGDQVSPVGTLVPNGVLMGFFINKSIAEKYGITSMKAFKRAEIAAIFDRDGDGKAGLLGCSKSSACASYVRERIEAHGWRVELLQADYSTLFKYVRSRIREGRPVLYWALAPSDMTAELVPGRDVRWLEAPSPPGTDTTAPHVPGCADAPCETGFVANSIRIVANEAFLRENPAARRLFELIRIPRQAIYKQKRRLYRDEHTTSTEAAEQWIQAHRAKVERWLKAARTAASDN